MAELPTEPTPEERVNALADMLRALPRTDRAPVLQRIETASADVAAAIRDRLYRIEDLLRIPDRQLQLLLSELEVKKLAMALKDVDAAIRDKVTANMSSRAKTVLNEESELLGQVPASALREARSEILGLVRRLEDEGRIVIEE
jgi:flagellar motor switch protein FliG